MVLRLKNGKTIAGKSSNAVVPLPTVSKAPIAAPADGWDQTINVQSEVITLDFHALVADVSIEESAIALDETLETRIDDAPLTHDQEILAAAVLNWLQSPGRSSRFMGGYAGTGKTYSLKEILRRAVEELGILRYSNIIGTAQTHRAKRQLMDSTGGQFWQYRSNASLLQMRPKLAEWNDYCQLQWDTLNAIAPHDLTIEDARRKAALIAYRSKCFGRNKNDFLPEKPPSEIAEDLQKQHDRTFPMARFKEQSGISLIICDEATMVPASVFNWLEELASCLDCKILYVGDSAQLPPVKEKRSKTLEVEMLHELTKVVRYDGLILEYATAVRDGLPYESLHFEMNESDDFKCINYAMGLKEVVRRLRAGEDAWILAATNQVVDDTNKLVRTMLKSSPELSYEVGDRLLCKEMISRDQHGNTRPFVGRKDSEGKPLQSYPLVENSAVIQIVDFKHISTAITPLGTEYTIYHAECAVFDGKELESIKYPSGLSKEQSYIKLIDPQQWAQWQEEESLMWKIYGTLDPKSAKRGQRGDRAKLAWELLGIKDWNTHFDGREIDTNEYRQYQGVLFSMIAQCRGIADLVTWPYCSTVHKAQGATVSHIYLHMPSLLRKSWKKDDTWDQKALLYTAATRAAKTLTFLT